MRPAVSSRRRSRPSPVTVLVVTTSIPSVAPPSSSRSISAESSESPASTFESTRREAAPESLASASMSWRRELPYPGVEGPRDDDDVHVRRHVLRLVVDLNTDRRTSRLRRPSRCRVPRVPVWNDPVAHDDLRPLVKWHSGGPCGHPGAWPSPGRSG